MGTVEKLYPWEKPDAPVHVLIRQTVHEIPAPHGIRTDLHPRRSAADIPPCLQNLDFGVVIMSHRGFSNGRLSVCLSSIPENYPVTVCTDSILPEDAEGDRKVAEWHGANFHHCTPWGGRAKNAIECMKCTDWEYTLFLCDDVWLFPETVTDMLRWSYIYIRNGIPMAALCAPRYETYHEHKDYGFETWADCLRKPWMFERLPPPNGFQKTPALYKNPFGACMMMYRPAYDDLGGFAPEYWAHDDVYNHKVWTSGKYVNCAYPGRGFCHLGAQSWHHGETAEYVGSFFAATGMLAEESGKLQDQFKIAAQDKYADIFERLGGQAGV